MEMIQKRQTFDTKQEHHDLFNNLLCANDEDAEITLDNDELLGASISNIAQWLLSTYDAMLGNIFMFLLAGGCWATTSSDSPSPSSSRYCTAFKRI